jgi:alpha-tubulin suppressor-like RCC1 family protein
MPKICTFGTKVSQVSCGEDHTVMVCLNNMENHVYAMGSNANGKLGIGADPDQVANCVIPTLVPSLKGICKVVCGRSHTLAID